MESLSLDKLFRGEKCADLVLLKTDIDGKALNAKYSPSSNNIYIDKGFTLDEVLDCLHPLTRDYFSKNNHIIFRKTADEKKATQRKYVEEHKEHLREKAKERLQNLPEDKREDLKQKKRDYQQQYYDRNYDDCLLKNRIRYLKQETCPICDKSYSVSNRSHHMKSKSHIAASASLAVQTV